MRVFPILFIALTEPRRALLASGLIARLASEIPNADITLVTTEESAQLYQDDPRIASIQVLKAPVLSLAGLKFVLSLRARTYGLTIDIGASALSQSPFAALIRTKTWARGTRARPAQREHPAQAMAGLLRFDEPVLPDLHVSEARLAGARAFLDDEAGRPLLVMAPGADWCGREWPAERFAAAAMRLLEDNPALRGGRLLIIGSQADHMSAVEVRTNIAHFTVLELTGRLDLLTAYAALKNASAFIGNEGIWLHLAAAAGIPAFGLYGPNDPRLDAPLGTQAHIIESPRSFKAIKAQDTGLNKPLCHMLDLSVSRVCEQVGRVLSREDPSHISIAAE